MKTMKATSQNGEHLSNGSSTPRTRHHKITGELTLSLTVKKMVEEGRLTGLFWVRKRTPKLGEKEENLFEVLPESAFGVKRREFYIGLI